LKLKYIRKFFLALSLLLLLFLLLFITTVVLLQRPGVQTYVVNRVLDRIEKQHQTKANVERIHLKFPTSLVLNEFYLEDQAGDTLIYAEKLHANFSFLQPFKRMVHISKVTLDGATLNLSKAENEDFNFGFLFKNKTKSKRKNVKKSAQPFDFDAYSVELNNTKVTFKSENKFLIEDAFLKQLKVNFNAFDVQNKSIDLNALMVDGLQLKYHSLGKGSPKKPFTLKSFLPEIGWTIQANRLEVANSNFQMLNPNAKLTDLPIHLEDLQFNDLNVKIADLQLDTTFQFKLNELSTNDGYAFNVKSFETKVNVSPNEILLNKLQLEVNNSSVKMNAKLTVADFQKFPERFYQSSSINAFLATNDANLFLPKSKKINQPVQLNLISSGNLQQLKLQEMILKSGNVELFANGKVNQLLPINSTYFDLNIDRLVGSAASVKQIFPWLEIPEQITALGNTNASGTITGQTNNLVTNLNVHTDIGAITTNIKVDARGKDLVYSGNVKVPMIDIQMLFPKAPVGKLAGTVELNGKGTQFDLLSGDINGQFEFIEINHYTYQDVSVLGNISEQIFTGNIQVDDPNLKLIFNGLLDLSDSIPEIVSQLKIENADLLALKLYDKPFRINLEGAVDLTGNDLSNLNGTLNLVSLHIENDSSAVDFDSTLFVIKSEPNFKSYDIISDKMSAHVEGNYDPIVLTKELQRYFSNYVYYLNFNDTTAIQPQNIKGNISIAEDFGLISFFIGTLDMPDNIAAEFEFNNTENIFNLHAHSNHLGYKQIEIDSFMLSAYTEDDELMVDAEFGQFSAAKGKIKINLVDLFAVSSKNNIAGKLEIEEESAENRFSISPHLNFNEDNVLVHFNNSYFKINNVEWPFTPTNELIFSEDEIIAKDFAIQNGDQYFQIVNASSDLSDALIEFKNLSIPGLANIFQLDTIITSGLLTGRVKLVDPLKDMKADVDLSFNQLKVFEYYCDSLSIDAFYDKALKNLNVGALFNDPNYDLFASGNYDLTKGAENPADFDIKVNRVSLSFLDRILKNEATFDLFGEGELQFQGSITKPILLGEAKVIDTAKIHIDFLGIDLIILPENGIQEKVFFTENSIDFQSINVRDPFGNRAYAEGKLTHNSFKDVAVDARLFTDNFNMLNTTFFENEDFYGKAFGEGSVNFSGLTKNINMDIDMKTKKGTHLSIPIASTGDTKEYGFSFIHPNKVIEIDKTVSNKIDLKGVTMNFDLEVTPEAVLELVLNSNSDNNLKASGNGDLSLRIDQNKQLSIYGKYNLIDGDYTFSPQNLINKEFKIENGSSIFWNGPPFEAALDVDALYAVNAKVDNIIQDSSRAAQNVPMDVVIHIGGTLKETDVSFGIEPRRSSITATLDEIESFLDEIKNDEGELTTQAISLLLVGRFLPSNSTVFTGTSFSAGEFGKTTALELVSNQISNYLTDAISKLITEVEFNFNIMQREDYSTQQPGQTTTVQLEYSQKFINNRLIVNIGGNFAFQDENSTAENNIAGDFEVEGLLTPDGKLRAKAYHRTADFDIFNQDRSRTGVSIAYQRDFDRIVEVFKVDANKKTQNQENRQKKKNDRNSNKNTKKEENAVIMKEEE
jgi:hypothetical protein